MRIKNKTILYILASPLLLVVLALVILFARRIPHINYTRINASSFAELQNNRNVSDHITGRLPKNIKNIYADYNQSYKCIFVSFNILESDFKHFTEARKMPITTKQNNTFIIFSMSSRHAIPENYVYYDRGRRYLE